MQLSGTFCGIYNMKIEQFTTIRFESLNKTSWLRKISQTRAFYDFSEYKKHIVLNFDSSLNADNLEPVHFVTLACLIQFFFNNEHRVYLNSSNDRIRNILLSDLRYKEYWSGGKNHVDSTDDNIFNLWRIVESEKDLYARNVELYFKKNFFSGKDLSVISLSIVEVYYNVFDHADANENAFSFVKYDEKNEMLHVAVCDFGKGIANSVRSFKPEITNDKDALLKSIELDFTVGSKIHNRGKGLDNILSCSSTVRIFCNNALLLKKKDSEIKMVDVDFYFGGTLIYLEIDLSIIEDEEILDSFDL